MKFLRYAYFVGVLCVFVIPSESFAHAPVRPGVTIQPLPQIEIPEEEPEELDIPVNPCLEVEFPKDGICDEKCPAQDIDCKRENYSEDDGDFCTEEGWYGDGTCDPKCPKPDPDCPKDQLPEKSQRILEGLEPEDICEEMGWYGDGVCDTECANHDIDCPKPEKREEEVQESAPVIDAKCTIEAPVQCPDGSCVASLTDCNDTATEEKASCPITLPFLCDSGSCASSEQACTAIEENEDEEEVDLEDFPIPTLPVVEALPFDLENYLADVVLSHAHVTKAEVIDGALSLYLDETAYLFGFITVSYRLGVTITADSSQLHKPWWLFLARDDAREVFEASEFARQSFGDTNADEYIRLLTETFLSALNTF